MQPDDLARQSLPFTYLSLEAESQDSKTHNVQVYSDITAGSYKISIVQGYLHSTSQNGLRVTAPRVRLGPLLTLTPQHTTLFNFRNLLVSPNWLTKPTIRLSTLQHLQYVLHLVHHLNTPVYPSTVQKIGMTSRIGVSNDTRSQFAAAGSLSGSPSTSSGTINR